MIATAQVPVWREIRASYAFVERNVNLSKRYWGWELTYLLYTIAQSAAVIYIADAVPQDPKHPFDVGAFTLYLAIGALTWSYMANLFMAIAESVQWERWEGTIEYSMMAPISILTYVLGSCLFGVLYGLIRTLLVLIAQIEDETLHVFLGTRIEAGCRLVEQEQDGRGEQRPRDRHLLLHPA